MKPLSIEIMEKEGFRKFIDQFKVSKELGSTSLHLDLSDPYKGTWQKCYSNDLGKKYFINIEVWDFSNSPFNKKAPISFTAWCQFETHEGQSFNCQLLSAKTVEDTESFFENQWINNVCKHYETYEEEEYVD